MRFRAAENLSPVYGDVKLKQEVPLPIKDMVFGLNNNVYALTDTAVSWSKFVKEKCQLESNRASFCNLSNFFVMMFISFNVPETFKRCEG